MNDKKFWFGLFCEYNLGIYLLMLIYYCIHGKKNKNSCHFLEQIPIYCTRIFSSYNHIFRKNKMSIKLNSACYSSEYGFYACLLLCLPSGSSWLGPMGESFTFGCYRCLDNDFHSFFCRFFIFVILKEKNDW